MPGALIQPPRNAGAAILHDRTAGLLRERAEIIHRVLDLRIGELVLERRILPMPFVVALIISASLIFFTSGSVAGLTFMALPAPESAMPVAPWHIWHLAL